MVTSDGIELYHAIQLNCKVTNNETEYEAVLVVLAIVETSSGEEVEMRANSQVVVGQIMWEYSTMG